MEKKRIPKLIKELTKEHEVFAPVKKESLVFFEKVSPGSEISLDFQNTTKSPKEVLFPQTEILFTYDIKKNGVEIEKAPELRKKIALLGIRPCDAKALSLLDKFFSSGDHKDFYFSEKRRNTTTIGLACNRPISTCFCTSMGGAPFGKEGMDLLLQDINDKYLIETVTEKGDKLVEKLPWLEDAEKADIEKARDLARDAERAVTSEISGMSVTKKLDGMFDNPLWDQIYKKCLGCGVCTYLCPTCCCFDVLDEATTKWKRIRIWDSCQFSCFTLQGSGYNPRPSGKERMRQRIMHKFNYFPKNHGENFCVGCGRCVQECPVNFDIREVVEGISTDIWRKKNG
ncbi:MAG: 4Fe-4S dicluster domain-containing protein [Candidatus Bathyarchaeota archaeon]|nr:MAG: 4Fe-4S dicluster domain-containing protein [Candidatus Bathyarchaeota archaeon]